MGSIFAEVVFAPTSGVPEDNVVNTFTFQTAAVGSPTSADYDDIAVFLQSFYNNAQTSGSTVANLLGTQLSRAANGVTIKQYDLDGHLLGDAHGSPRRVSTFTLGASQGGETNMPSEVAICLSYHALLTDFQQELGNTRPAARRRGRLYLGPLCTLARTQDATTGDVKVSSVARSTLTQAATALLASPTVSWSQWSRKQAAVSDVTGGFVDDAFDTQRRRGRNASLRTSFGGA